MPRIFDNIEQQFLPALGETNGSCVYVEAIFLITRFCYEATS
jgi:hypothetical protein